MSHPEQRRFCKQVKRKYPQFFRRCLVADVGSLDINGSNKRLFRRCNYKGIDVFYGKNVDVVGEAHWVLPQIVEKVIEETTVPAGYRVRITNRLFDTIISTEALEHDKHLPKTLRAMYACLKPGGLLLITAAGTGRPEHGTSKERPQDSPGTNDHYQNITNGMFAEILPPHLFKAYHIAQDPANCDFQFYGIKNN